MNSKNKVKKKDFKTPKNTRVNNQSIKPRMLKSLAGCLTELSASDLY